VGLPFVLYLPGVALVSAANPRSGQGSDAERQLWYFGASMIAVLLGGLLLNLAGGLTGNHWIVYITSATVAFALVGWVRSVLRARSTALEPDLVAGQEGTLATSAPTRSRRALTPRQVVLLLAAVGMGAGTIALSEHSVATSARESFVQAWILPEPLHNPWGKSAFLGVRNQLGETQAFVVTAVLSPRKGGPSSTLKWTKVLAQGSSWTQQIRRESGEPVRVTVALARTPATILSSVSLANPAH
ncbi:MAG TPA: DUF1616 domain-containing protein, partial [Acidimicrobiales bacterium]